MSQVSCHGRCHVLNHYIISPLRWLISWWVKYHHIYIYLSLLCEISCCYCFIQLFCLCVYCAEQGMTFFKVLTSSSSTESIYSNDFHKVLSFLTFLNIFFCLFLIHTCRHVNITYARGIDHIFSAYSTQCMSTVVF